MLAPLALGVLLTSALLLRQGSSPARPAMAPPIIAAQPETVAARGEAPRMEHRPPARRELPHKPLVRGLSQPSDSPPAGKAQGTDSIRARYPKRWEVTVPPGTRLDSLRRALDSELSALPPNDLDDRTALPIWFRVYLRKKNPDLPTSGPYQYPRTAPAILRWMLSHPDSVKS